jgi:hypothetical protein
MSTNRNLNQRMRAALYQLKREYGGRIDVYKKGAVSSDPATGVRTISKTLTVLKRAIILPASVARREVRGISAISANKSFVVGGGYDNSTKVFIIDRRDAPDLMLTNDDWIVFAGQKFEINDFEPFEFDTCWIITAKALIGEVPEQIHLVKAENFLTLTSATERIPDNIHLVGVEQELELDSEPTATVE